MEKYTIYKEQFSNFLSSTYINEQHKGLYEPAEYILFNGGKRFRPVLTLLVADAIDDIDKPTLQAALAIELFHNFTLVHDDIMDRASLRRGLSTVHTTFGVNQAILSGDAMMIQATRLMLQAEEQKACSGLTDFFLATAIAVCEGQQMDMEFEARTDVDIPEYLTMIEKKTGALLGFAMYAGARLAGQSHHSAYAFHNFGKHTGVLFQIWDDYLDVFGSEITGKVQGGDLYNRKETFLILQLRNEMSASDRNKFLSMWQREIGEQEVQAICNLLKKYQIQSKVKDYVVNKLQLAKDDFIHHSGKYEWTKPIVDFVDSFIQRDH